MTNSASITATLKEIEYNPGLSHSLKVFGMDDLVSGRMSSKASFLLKSNSETYAISQWLSPKRTRSYPFARVYGTLHIKNRVTLIPFCKDEGKDGDRDYIQWDTVSLMSVLNVYVIVCYYQNAEKNLRPNQQHKHKITKQSFDYDYIADQLGELQNYHSSALHWNLKQMENLHNVGELTVNAYRKILPKRTFYYTAKQV